MFSQSDFLQADRRQSHQGQVFSPAAKRVPPCRGSHTARDLPRPSLKVWQRLALFWQQFFQRFDQRSHISIKEQINARGDRCWYITNPHSGRSFYAETLNEAIHWIEAQHFGK